jgi:hypothetical protein
MSLAVDEEQGVVLWGSEASAQVQAPFVVVPFSTLISSDLCLYCVAGMLFVFGAADAAVLEPQQVFLGTNEAKAVPDEARPHPWDGSLERPAAQVDVGKRN